MREAPPPHSVYSIGKSIHDSILKSPRLFLLKPDSEQIQDLLDHTDSPYIRAVSFSNIEHLKVLKDWISVPTVCWRS